MMKINEKRLDKRVKRIKQMIAGIICSSLMVLCRVNVYAGEIGSSKAATGTINLFNDFSSVLMILAPIIGAAMGAYCFIKKSLSDEQDYRSYDKRIKSIVICVIGAELIGGIIKIVCNYYN